MSEQERDQGLKGSWRSSQERLAKNIEDVRQDMSEGWERMQDKFKKIGEEIKRTWSQSPLGSRPSSTEQPVPSETVVERTEEIVAHTTQMSPPERKSRHTMTQPDENPQ
ncbi:hypothetical protein P9112_002002 [Eukaryota sp. TZLM1-RC]